MGRRALAGLAQRFESWPEDGRVQGSIPVKGAHPGCRLDPGPGWGTRERHPMDVPPPPLSLKIKRNGLTRGRLTSARRRTSSERANRAPAGVSAAYAERPAPPAREPLPQPPAGTPREGSGRCHRLTPSTWTVLTTILLQRHSWQPQDTHTHTRTGCWPAGVAQCTECHSHAPNVCLLDIRSAGGALTPRRERAGGG